MAGPLGVSPYQIIVDADVGAMLEARELGTEESFDAMRYARNEAWSRKKPIICVVVVDGWAYAARSEVPDKNPAMAKKDAPAAVTAGAS